MRAVRFEKVTKNFGDVKAVEDLSFEVEAGELFVILGPSGCGKTTTLRMLAGLERPASGKIEIDSQVANDPETILPPHKRGIGMMFQDLALWPHMRVRGNLEFPLKGTKISRSTRKEKVREALKLVDLEKKKNLYPHQLSGGERQRLALARALVLEPRILLLDEPLVNLDENLREHLRNEIVRLQRRLNITTIYVTHSQDDGLAIADRILIMNKGRAEQVSTPQAVYREPDNLFVASFIGGGNVLEGECIAGGRARTVLGDLECRDGHPGREVFVLVRPEQIKTASGNGVKGKVREGIYKGNFWLWKIEVEGKVLTVQTENPLEKGSPIQLQVEGRAHLIGKRENLKQE